MRPAINPVSRLAVDVGELLVIRVSAVPVLVEVERRIGRQIRFYFVVVRRVVVGLGWIQVTWDRQER